MQLQSTDKYVIGLYLGIGDNKIQVNYTLLTLIGVILTLFTCLKSHFTT